MFYNAGCVITMQYIGYVVTYLVVKVTRTTYGGYCERETVVNSSLDGLLGNGDRNQWV
jgi:hypothetical protein